MPANDDHGNQTQHVWIARISQEYGNDVIIPARSRLVAEEHAERHVEEYADETLGEWHESIPEDDGSLVAFGDEQRAIISKRRVKTEFPEGRNPIP